MGDSVGGRVSLGATGCVDVAGAGLRAGKGGADDTGGEEGGETSDALTPAELSRADAGAGKAGALADEAWCLLFAVQAASVANVKATPAARRAAKAMRPVYD
jgi:hypothetical protein